MWMNFSNCKDGFRVPDDTTKIMSNLKKKLSTIQFFHTFYIRMF